MSAPIFREVAAEADCLAVEKLAREIWNQHYVAITGQGQVDYMLTRFQRSAAILAQIVEGSRYFLVADGEAFVGYLAVVPCPRNADMKLSKLYLLQSYRGRGWGRAMVEVAERVCRESGLKSLWLTVNKHNSDAIAAYGRMGFHNTGPVETDIGDGYVMDDCRMEKALV